MGIIFVILAILLIFGLLGAPRYRGVGNGPWNWLWLLVVIFVVLALVGGFSGGPSG